MNNQDKDSASVMSSTAAHTLIAAAVAAVLLAGCASVPLAPPGAAEARNKLTLLQSNPELATRSPAAIKDAELAVRAAETPQKGHDAKDDQLAAYRVYMADRKVDIAEAQARTSLAEEQRVGLAQQRDKARLDARTKEADRASLQLANTKVALADEKRTADASREEAEAAAARAALLQRQMDELQAKQTDRGMVLTLGDVLFATGKADLKPGTANHLNKLAAFLNNYPDRNVTIEGYTDSVGGEDYNLGLSQRRADSVKNFLLAQGIGATRLITSGKGQSSPVADNSSASGRQQNRRVEVIISNPQTASR